LNETNPGTSDFVAQMLLVAHDVAGYGHELELPIARAFVNAFYDHGIVGEELTRLAQYANGNAEKAYDVLTVEEELKSFRAARS
jgi:hypothetical protein